MDTVDTIIAIGPKSLRGRLQDMGTMLAEPMYTIASTSSALGLSRKTVWGMVADGKIASHRFGRAIRIPQSEVQRLLEESFRPARRAAS